VIFSSALGNRQRDVVVLFMDAEPPNFVDDSGYDALGWQLPMSPEGVHQAPLSEFLSLAIGRLGYPIGVDRQRISGEESPLIDTAIPFAEQSQYRGRRLEPLECVIAPEEKTRKVTAIRVS
jgi:hypothetical protein